MATMPPVLHSAARAITAAEFSDALCALTPRRFPNARATRHRAVSLAISGGVDSMALAYLCSRLRLVNPWLKVADHPVRAWEAIIIDHQLRAGSHEEARAVAKVLRTRLHMSADVFPINWARNLGDDVDTSPEGLSKLPNIESLARRMRYRILGNACIHNNTTSLLLAHHEDDQYETVLMRLMSGHGMRGLRGIRPAGDIPECGDLHGVYQSGFVDELSKDRPLYMLGVTRRERGHLKRDLRSTIDYDDFAADMEEGLFQEEGSGQHPYLSSVYDLPTLLEKTGRPRRTAAPLEPMDIEDGGMQIYRPLLGFSKERLIATCLHNRIPWFDDATNSDPTLTMRNAVRHLVKSHELPVALQKPAVLRLAERCRDKVAEEDAQAERLLERVTIRDFEPNTGTAVVQLPDVRMPSVPRRGSPRRREKRRVQYTRIAGIVIQKLLALVTPETHVTALKDLGWVAARLFPSLAETDPGVPKAFTICGVHLIPLPGPPLRWHLSRAPHASMMTRPVMQIAKQTYTHRWRTGTHMWRFSRWSNWGLWDNRFWVSIRSRVPFFITVAPYEAEHAKSFREALPPRARDNLDAALRKYAPGKVRYTLPAIYVRGDVGPLIMGEEDWKIHDDILEGLDVGDGSDNDESVELGDGYRLWKKRQKVGRSRPPILKKHPWTRDEMKKALLDDKVTLVALPTLGVCIPGIQSWVDWSFRYRKVELETLALAAGAMYERKRATRARIREMRRKMNMQGRGTRVGWASKGAFPAVGNLHVADTLS